MPPLGAPRPGLGSGRRPAVDWRPWPAWLQSFETCSDSTAAHWRDSSTCSWRRTRTPASSSPAVPSRTGPAFFRWDRLLANRMSKRRQARAQVATADRRPVDDRRPTAGGSVVEALDMPGPVDSVEVHESQPVLAGDLEVVASNRPAPPALLDAPAIADLDSLAPATPAERDQLPVGTELDLDRGVLAQQSRHRADPRRGGGVAAAGRAPPAAAGRAVE